MDEIKKGKCAWKKSTRRRNRKGSGREETYYSSSKCMAMMW